ncbi:MAG: chemotaxis protein CheW [Candidatus Edwardsbacteria bacterium]
MLHFLTFRLAGEEYGLDLSSVEEIIEPRYIQVLPGLPVSYLGIMELQGRNIPVIDLMACLKLSAQGEMLNNALLICRFSSACLSGQAGGGREGTPGGEREIGILVDEVGETLAISPEEIRPVPPLLSKEKEHWLGIVLRKERLILLINLEKLAL